MESSERSSGNSEHALPRVLTSASRFLLLLGGYFLLNRAWVSSRDWMRGVVRLKMEQRPPIILRQPSDIAAAVDASVTFDVSLSETPEKQFFRWYKDGIEISGATNSTLTLTNISEADGGSYSLFVANGRTLRRHR